MFISQSWVIHVRDMVHDLHISTSQRSGTVDARETENPLSSCLCRIVFPDLSIDKFTLLLTNRVLCRCP